jgi:hypothetical protein
MSPDLDSWIERPQVRIRHQREAAVEPAVLWAAARAVRVEETGALGRMIKLRIPGLARGLSFDELFRSPPFYVLHEGDAELVSGLVGRIWTLRRDYPRLSGPDEFRRWSQRGTVRVLFANWVEPQPSGGATLVSEARVAAVDGWGRLGIHAVRPLILSSQHLIGSEGINTAVRLAESTPA